MGIAHRLIKKEMKIEDRAIRAYQGFLNCVEGNIKKYTLAEVLQGETKKGVDISWLRKAYQKVIDFAQDARLKQITPPEKEYEEMPMKLPIVRLYGSQPVELN